jgi:hypothetical protein
LRDGVATLIAQHQLAGDFAADVDPHDAARLIMHVYLNEQRAWLDEAAPDVQHGMTTLLRFLAVLLRGFTGEPV